MIGNAMSSSGSPEKYPWQIKEMNVGVKFLVTLAVIVLVMVALGTGFGALVGLGTLFNSTSDTLLTNLLSLVIMLALTGGSGVALFFLWPQMRKPTSFTPKTGITEPSRAAALLSVKFEPPAFATTLRGDGTVTFTESDLMLSGTQPPNGLVQLGVVLVVTVLPLAIFGCGLGLLPALVLAYYIGRKQVTLAIPYSQVMVQSVKGTTVHLKAAASSPDNVRFRVSSLDGERLYRELYQRLPQAVSPWQAELSALSRGAPVAG